MDRDLISQYQTAGEKLLQAVRGLTVQDMGAMPDPADKVGAWSIQQVVVHVADSDLVMADRMKRIIAEDNPPLVAFDETKWARELHYELQPVEEAAALVDLNHRIFGRVLEALPDDSWRRIGTHSERGPLRLDQVLEGAVRHLEHHLRFIYAKREKMGKLMW
jgi:hypothetical protein